MDDEEIMTMTDKLTAIAVRYGYDAQSRQCIEEMAELTQAINKYHRKVLKSGRKAFDMTHVLPDENGFIQIQPDEYHNIVEELADVQIMIWQMSFFLNADLTEIIQSKINRQLARIKSKEGKKK